MDDVIQGAGIGLAAFIVIAVVVRLMWRFRDGAPNAPDSLEGAIEEVTGGTSASEEQVIGLKESEYESEERAKKEGRLAAWIREEDSRGHCIAIYT